MSEAERAKAMLVTGGASGIGLAVARHFAARGWRVGLADVDAAGMEAARAHFDPARLSVHRMDVRDREHWLETLSAFAAAHGGRLDLLFNNAGVPVSGGFADTDFAELDRAIDINFTGVVNGARLAHPLLRATPGSCMLITSSAAGIYGTAGAAIYSATKFAVRGLAEALDGEWRHDGIRVRTLMPSFIDTPLLDHNVTGSNRSVRESVRAGGLEITPVEEVAEAAWRAVHGDQVHTVVGKTAKRMRFAARWMPNSLRRQMGRRLDVPPRQG